MTIGLTWRRTARRIKRLKEGVLTISRDYSDRPTPDFLALSLLEMLDDRERKIILKRFELDGGKAETLEEVGKKFEVTRERLRQLQNIALAKLRRALAKREKPIVRRDCHAARN
jgi:DNA-directed RNA polymerase sigma subunit (sigma70/sigma32)